MIFVLLFNPIFVAHVTDMPKAHNLDLQGLRHYEGPRGHLDAGLLALLHCAGLNNFTAHSPRRGVLEYIEGTGQPRNANRD